MQLIIQKIAQQAVDFLRAEHPNLEEGTDILHHFVDLGEYVTSPLPATPDLQENPGKQLLETLERRATRLEDAVGMFLQDRKAVEEIETSCARLAKPLPEPSTSFTENIFDGFENVVVKGFEWKNFGILQTSMFLGDEPLETYLKNPLNTSLTWIHEHEILASCHWAKLNQSEKPLYFEDIQSILDQIQED